MKVLNDKKALEEQYKDEFSEEKILERVHYYKVTNEEEQTTLLFSLEKILRQQPNIKLVVFDYFNVILRTTESSYSEEKRFTSNVLLYFLQLAKTYNVAFVLNNTLKSSRKKDGTSKLEPKFGEHLFQSVTNRVSVDREPKYGDDVFKATMLKGSIFYTRNSTFKMHFRIKESGVSAEID